MRLEETLTEVGDCVVSVRKQIWLNGEVRTVSHLAYEKFHGELPPPGTNLVRTCGTLDCVKHLERSQRVDVSGEEGTAAEVAEKTGLTPQTVRKYRHLDRVKRRFLG